MPPSCVLPILVAPSWAIARLQRSATVRPYRCTKNRFHMLKHIRAAFCVIRAQPAAAGMSYAHLSVVNVNRASTQRGLAAPMQQLPQPTLPRLPAHPHPSLPPRQPPHHSHAAASTVALATDSRLDCTLWSPSPSLSSTSHTARPIATGPAPGLPPRLPAVPPSHQPHSPFGLLPRPPAAPPPHPHQPHGPFLLFMRTSFNRTAPSSCS